MSAGVTLDFSKAQPIPQQPVTLDFSKAQPISQNTPAPQQQQPGFWENLGHTFGIGQQEAAQQEKEFKEHPVRTLLAPAIGPILPMAQGLAHGFMRSTGEVGQAIDALQARNPAAAGVHAVQAIPFVGPAMQTMSDQSNPVAANASYGERLKAAVTPGNVGTALGTSAQLAPMALGAVDAAFPGRPLVPNIPVGNMAGRAALLGRTPEQAYTNALKPSTTLTDAQRSNVVQTALQNEIPVSKAGLEKLGSLIDDLNDKIKGTIAQDPNRPIDPNAVSTRTDATKQRFSQQVNAQPDLSAIEASRQQFLREQGAPVDMQGNLIGPAPSMGAANAQAMKTGTYRVLAGKYGEQGSASVEAQKALARGLKEEIATQFPEINNLNAAESRLLDLQPILERAVNRISNHQAVGIGTPIVGTAATAMTGSAPVGVVASVMKSVLDNPAVASRLAIAVSKGSKVPIGVAASKVANYLSTLGAASAATQSHSAPDTQNQGDVQ